MFEPGWHPPAIYGVCYAVKTLSRLVSKERNQIALCTLGNSAGLAVAWLPALVKQLLPTYVCTKRSCYRTVTRCTTIGGVLFDKALGLHSPGMPSICSPDTLPCLQGPPTLPDTPGYSRILTDTPGYSRILPDTHGAGSGNSMSAQQAATRSHSRRMTLPGSYASTLRTSHVMYVRGASRNACPAYGPR